LSSGNDDTMMIQSKEGTALTDLWASFQFFVANTCTNDWK